jgi:hypothetical protein
MYKFINDHKNFEILEETNNSLKKEALIQV